MLRLFHFYCFIVVFSSPVVRLLMAIYGMFHVKSNYFSGLFCKTKHGW